MKKQRITIIEGLYITLPPEAKYVFWESTGVVYYRTEKPRVVVDDPQKKHRHKGSTPIGFSAEKTPVQIKDENGFDRVLRITCPRARANWQQSITATMCV